MAAPAGTALHVAGGGLDEALQEVEARLETGSLKLGIFIVLRDAGPTGAATAVLHTTLIDVFPSETASLTAANCLLYVIGC